MRDIIAMALYISEVAYLYVSGILIGASEASPFLVMNVEILSVCLCVCVSVCLCVCHGPARYSFFVLVTLYQPLRESMRMGTMKLNTQATCTGMQYRY